MRALGSNRSVTLQRWLGGGVLVLLACGEASENGGPAAGAPEASDTSGMGGPAAGAGPDAYTVCPTPIGTAEELALTPRADTGLEQLALALDAGRLTATQATYERVVADIGAIRALAPSLANIGFSPPYGYELTLNFNDAATDAMAAGRYTAWDCLLEAYRAEMQPMIDIFPYTPTFFLGGIFDMPQIADLFDQLPGVTSQIYANDVSRTLCVSREGEHYEYVVDRTNGTCDAPTAPRCTGSARHFTTNSPGAPTVLETWTAKAGEGAPAWFHDVCN
jgi:hypothetical protein